jgi:hypothetical protein
MGFPDPRRRQTQAGNRVRFRVEDVFWSNEEGVFAPLAPGTEVDGVIVSFSDSGSKPKAFAVVEVVRKQTLIVPLEKLQAWLPDSRIG